MSKLKVGSPEFIAEARSLGLDPYEYYAILVEAGKLKGIKRSKDEDARRRGYKDRLDLIYKMRDEQYRRYGYRSYDDFYIQTEIIGKNRTVRSKRLMEKYLRDYIMPMLDEWSGLFDYFVQEQKRRLESTNKLLKEFCNNMGYTVGDYPDHYANLKGYKDWQQFKKHNYNNRDVCRSLKKKYCETKDPNSLFLSLNILREVTGCRIPIKEEERIKKEQWLQGELDKIEIQRKIEMEKYNEEIEKYNKEEKEIKIIRYKEMKEISQISQIKYEVRIIGGKPHKCKTDNGIIIKDCGQYDIFKRQVVGPPLMTDEELIQKPKESILKL